MAFDEIFDAACADLNLPRFAKTANARKVINMVREGGRWVAKSRQAPHLLTGKVSKGINPWYMVPAVGAGAYGLSKVPKMFSGGNGEGGEMTMPWDSPVGPQESFTPSGHRYRDLYQLAQASAQHGF